MHQCNTFGYAILGHEGVHVGWKRLHLGLTTQYTHQTHSVDR